MIIVIITERRKNGNKKVVTPRKKKNNGNYIPIINVCGIYYGFASLIYSTDTVYLNLIKINLS